MFDKFATFFRNCGKKIILINIIFSLVFKITSKLLLRSFNKKIFGT